MARTLRNLPFAPDLIARRVGNERQITGLLETTGSAVSEEMITRYAALAASRDHVDGTLAMMAEWDLADLLARLPEIATPARFIVGLADRTVLPSVSEHAVGRMPDATLIEHPGGHLLHEEAPELIASEVTAIIAEKPQKALS